MTRGTTGLKTYFSRSSFAFYAPFFILAAVQAYLNSRSLEEFLLVYLVMSPFVFVFAAFCFMIASRFKRKSQ